ncbi:MAG: endo alpha-1,4 polygalactosaminidase [Planctomycetes bacterium]|nr:endo alpha-1,4 polygalactosaminidase [Planctomycetota bacterium]
MNRKRFAIASASAIGLLLLGSCNEENKEEQTVIVDTDGEVPESPSDPVCVWNHAYQENYENDSIVDILAGAENCYVLVDLYVEPEARDAIAEMQAAGNTIGCYISVGTCEDWRDDFDDIREFCTAREWDEWEGEFFVKDVEGILPFMKARINQLADWGCDMVEFDNMDWAGDQEQNAEFGVDITPDQAIAYYQTLCKAVHDAGMDCMAKNTREGAKGFNGGTFESYPDELDWWEHDHLQSFIDEGLHGIIFHYDERDCDAVTLWYRQRYGSGLSVLCEDPSMKGYRH